jgi:hypothetical protein
MPAAVISTKLVHDVIPATVPSTVSPPPHEFEDKSQETTITTQDGDAAIAEGSVSDGLSPAKSQSANEKASILRPSNIEDVPVMNDPRQWSQRRKVGDKVIRSTVLVLMAAAACCTRHCSLCGARSYFRRFHLPT